MAFFSGTNCAPLMELPAPPSKSYAQRMLACMFLTPAQSDTRLERLSESKDSVALCSYLETVGLSKTPTKIRKVEEPKELPPASFGEAGFSTRMMSIVLAVKACHIGQGEVEISGEGTIMNRTFDDVKNVIELIGGRIETDGPLMLPYKIETDGIDTSKFVTPDGLDSSQAISGLMIASAIDRGCEIVKAKVPSVKYLEMTAETMRKFCIRVIEDDEKFVIPGGQHYVAPIEYIVPGDWSGAAFLLAYTALAGKSNVVISNLSDRHQADSAFIKLSRDLGVRFKEIDNPNITGVGYLYEWSQQGIHREIDITHCPDIAMPLASLCGIGITVHMKGVSRLRNKECDRLEAIMDVLETFGCRCTLKEPADMLSITPHSGTMWPKVNTIDSRGDHRIAMLARAMLARVPVSDGIEIMDAECVDKSFKTFYTALQSIDEA